MRIEIKQLIPAFVLSGLAVVMLALAIIFDSYSFIWWEVAAVCLIFAGSMFIKYRKQGTALSLLSGLVAAVVPVFRPYAVTLCAAAVIVIFVAGLFGGKNVGAKRNQP